MDHINIVKFDPEKKKELKDRILTVDVFKTRSKGIGYSYSMKKHGKVKKSDEFIAYCLLTAVEDIVKYSGDPCDILELFDQIFERLEDFEDE